jgi:hypothetical protein
MPIPQGLHKRSLVLADRLERQRGTFIVYWTVVASLACVVRLAASPLSDLSTSAQIASILPYVLVVLAPVVSMLLADRWFSDSEGRVQPKFRLAVIGRWRTMPLKEICKSPDYGVAGVLVSLLLGILLNVPWRVAEFLAAIPALGASPPSWFGSLYTWALADTVLMSSLYAVTFMAALRREPLFPRLLMLVWIVDMTMQVFIAQRVGLQPDLPQEVRESLLPLLTHNVHKVLISAGVWLPYLLLSRRVNATYRLRLPADSHSVE